MLRLAFGFLKFVISFCTILLQLLDRFRLVRRLQPDRHPGSVPLAAHGAITFVAFSGGGWWRCLLVRVCIPPVWRRRRDVRIDLGRRVAFVGFSLGLVGFGLSFVRLSFVSFCFGLVGLESFLLSGVRVDFIGVGLRLFNFKQLLLVGFGLCCRVRLGLLVVQLLLLVSLDLGFVGLRLREPLSNACV